MHNFVSVYNSKFPQNSHRIPKNSNRTLNQFPKNPNHESSTVHCNSKEFPKKNSKQFPKNSFFIFFNYKRILKNSKEILTRAYTLVCLIDVHARLLILRKNFPLHGPILVCMFIVFEKKIPLHVYSILHVYWYLPCMFINFEKKIPPARPYLGLHV